MLRGSSLARAAALALEQPLGGELPAQALDPRQQVALAGDAHVVHGEAEAGRGGRAAGVVVAAAREHHLHAVLRAPPRRAHHRLPVVPPGAAGDRAGGVAQLEVHARARAMRRLPSSPMICTRANARSLIAQRGRVLAHRKGPRERAVGDARARPGSAGDWQAAISDQRIGASIDANAARRTPVRLPERAVVIAKRQRGPSRQARPQAPGERLPRTARACRARRARRRARIVPPREAPARECAQRRRRERPPAPWHPLPLSELLILVGAVGVVLAWQRGASGSHCAAARDGLAAVAIGTRRGDAARAPRWLSLPRRAAGVIPAIVLHSAVLLGSRAPSSACRAGSTSRCSRSTSRSSAFLFKYLRRRYLDARRERRSSRAAAAERPRAAARDSPARGKLSRAASSARSSDGSGRSPSTSPSPRFSPLKPRRSSRAISRSPSMRAGCSGGRSRDQLGDAVAQLQREMRRGGAHQLAHVLDRHLVRAALALAACRGSSASLITSPFLSGRRAAARARAASRTVRRTLLRRSACSG